MFAKLKDFDFYRKIPKDLTEASTHGSILSICGILFMLILFALELIAFLSVSYTTTVGIDTSVESTIRINFNITMLDLPCEFAVIDVVDILGSRYDNVTKNVNKWQIDSEGVRRNYAGRNREQPDIMHDTHHDHDALLANGVHAVPIGDSNFESVIKTRKYVFVNFYAPWCVWCQRLEPVWEAFAEHVEKEQLDISIVKVDCVENRQTCTNQKIQAFPMLRMFRDGESLSPDYRSDRTVDALTEFVRARFKNDDFISRLGPDEKEAHLKAEELRKDDHPGCMLSGFLLVNRVPGNFHLEARSNLHNLNPLMSNMSHVVNQLSFGPVLTKSATRKLEKLPSDYFSMDSMSPMNGRVYVNSKLHQAFHHHMKVVTTNIDFVSQKSSFDVYQIVQASQIMQYSEEDVPEARFSYDLSPMAVTINKNGKELYEFITSICAVIGGTFTILGLISGFLGTIFKSKKI